VVVHGGAGNLTRANTGVGRAQRMREGIQQALLAAQRILLQGASALDAVELAVSTLENDEQFNAGRGSVLAADGRVQMDASIMRGSDRAAGAVACVRTVKNPVKAARQVMEKTPHVILTGNFADGFAARLGLGNEPEAYFITPARLRQLERHAAEPALDHDASMGTVGAVAFDADGNLAAATSTGGVVGQSPGRVGDSPIIGAGTWADAATCAVSATGMGELILRTSLAHEVASLMRYRCLGIARACRLALDQVVALGGSAGCVAIDRNGNYSLTLAAPGMARGVVSGSTAPKVALFGDEASSHV
jgi:isoaspartyl peptidase/L-asparaginase-like protein (Ntn-hydrolase superfamily)